MKTYGLDKVIVHPILQTYDVSALFQDRDPADIRKHFDSLTNQVGMVPGLSNKQTVKVIFHHAGHMPNLYENPDMITFIENVQEIFSYPVSDSIARYGVQRFMTVENRVDAVVHYLMTEAETKNAELLCNTLLMLVMHEGTDETLMYSASFALLRDQDNTYRLVAHTYENCGLHIDNNQVEVFVSEYLTDTHVDYDFGLMFALKYWQIDPTPFKAGKCPILETFQGYFATKAAMNENPFQFHKAQYNFLIAALITSNEARLLDQAYRNLKTTFPNMTRSDLNFQQNDNALQYAVPVYYDEDDLVLDLDDVLLDFLTQDESDAITENPDLCHGVFVVHRQVDLSDELSDAFSDALFEDWGFNFSGSPKDADTPVLLEALRNKNSASEARGNSNFIVVYNGHKVVKANLTQTNWYVLNGLVPYLLKLASSERYLDFADPVDLGLLDNTHVLVSDSYRKPVK